MALAGANRLARLRAEQAADDAASREQNVTLRIAKRASIMGGLSNVMSGGDATSPWNLPWFPAAAGATVLGGGALGYVGVDKIMQKLRQSAADRELNQAKQEYEQAMFGGDVPDESRFADKQAAEPCELAKNVRTIVRVLEKRGNDNLVSPKADRIMSTLAGMYLLAAGGVGGLSFYHGYKNRDAKSNSRLVNRAYQERMMTEQRPSTLLPEVVTAEPVEPTP
jgi:hypothetical protein